MFAEPAFCQFTSTKRVLLLFSIKRNTLPNFQYVLIISGQISVSRALDSNSFGRAPHEFGTEDNYTCLDVYAVPHAFSTTLWLVVNRYIFHNIDSRVGDFLLSISQNLIEISQVILTAFSTTSTSDNGTSHHQHQKGQKRCEAQAEASARYRERNRAAVLEAGRLRAARRRDHIRKNLRGEAATEALRRVRKASAKYRARNREELAARQCDVRKRAFINKHGIHACIQPRFDAPIPRREDTPDPDVAAGVEGQDLDWGGLIDHTYSASSICDYVDPCLKRLH
ncbi:hypothetical protein C8R47DRAFT_1210403 [Mycena vitilis]|nr:hypothetical protein C8R47DRAFT_1210403 [Mycena vitilis]